MLYVDVDSGIAYDATEVEQAYCRDVVRMVVEHPGAPVPTFEAWLDHMRNVGLMLVDIDEYLRTIFDR